MSKWSHDTIETVRTTIILSFSIPGRPVWRPIV